MLELENSYKLIIKVFTSFSRQIKDQGTYYYMTGLIYIQACSNVTTNHTMLISHSLYMNFCNGFLQR